MTGCDADTVLVAVELRTDYVGVDEFTEIEVEIEGVGVMLNPADTGSYLDGRRVAEFHAVPRGARRVHLRLGREGDPFASQSVLVDVQDRQVVTVLLTRDCRNVSCDPSSVCFGGQCVAEGCSGESPELCGDPVCESSIDCPAVASCSESRCLAGACFVEDAACVTPLEVGAGGHFSCTRTDQQTVYCWGHNDSGQLGLGDGAAENVFVPSLVPGLTDAVELDLGVQTACAVRSGGGVACWGWGAFGQIGDGVDTSRTSPTDVTGIDDALDVTVAHMHACALRAGGAVSCWGANDLGQLGDGRAHEVCQLDRDCSTVPVPVTLPAPAVAIGSGHYHTCAILDDGRTACWGDDTDGQLGTAGGGVGGFEGTPVIFTELGDAVQLSGSERNSCAVTARATVECWGDNLLGPLGTGDEVDSATPVAAAMMTDAVEVSAGGDYSCAYRADGMAYCWGSGRLGDASMDAAFDGTQVRLLGVTSLSAGPVHTCAIADEELACWGFAGRGALGFGSPSTPDELTPVTVVFP